jgi:hypothetical protein
VGAFSIGRGYGIPLSFQPRGIWQLAYEPGSSFMTVDPDVANEG